MHSAAVGDVNRDGFLDIIGGFANGSNTWTGTENILFVNGGNSNHFISARLIGDSSHINGIGARVEVYGGFGMQIREIRSGESYGIMNSLNAHFGLGTHTTIDSLIVRWPSGIVDKWMNLAADQFLTIHEGTGPCDCNVPATHVVSSTTNSGPGSLRQVINSAGPCDTISFAPGLQSDTITLSGQPLIFGKSLHLEGFTGADLVINIAESSAAWYVPPGVTTSLHGITLRDAVVAPLDPVPILTNGGILILEDVHFLAQDPFPVDQVFVEMLGAVTHRGNVSIQSE